MSRLAGIDLNLLVALDALLEERSVTRAARRVGLSQSALSHALARLRALTGDRLLVRTARELVPTPRARALRAPIAAALAQIEQALHEPAPFDPRSVERAVRIAAIDWAQNALVPALSLRLARSAPGVDLIVVPYGQDITRALADGRIDLALGLERSLPHLHQQTIARDRFVCAVRRGHPCLQQRLTAARFARLRHVLITPRGLARGFVDRALEGKKLRRRVVLTVPSFTAAALAVARSDLVLTVAERVARSASTPLVLVDPPLPLPPLVLTMAWHERQDADPLHRWLRAELASVERS